MESEVLSFMPAMVNRGRMVLPLTPEHQVALARWAIKTAMVYEYVGDREEPSSSRANRTPSPGSRP